MKVYHNGVNVTSSALETITGGGNTYAIAESSGAFSIYRNTTEQAPALVDEYSIWSTQLLDSEILSIYNSGTPDSLDDVAHGAAVNAYTHWFRMGDAPNDLTAFPTLHNMNTSNNDLTIVNGTLANFISDVP